MEAVIAQLQQQLGWPAAAFDYHPPVPGVIRSARAECVWTAGGLPILLEVPDLTYPPGAPELAVTAMRVRAARAALAISFAQGVSVMVPYDDEWQLAKIASLRLEPNDPQGEQFANLLQASTFEAAALMQWAQHRLRRLRAAEELAKRLRSLTANDARQVRQLLVARLIAEGFDSQEAASAIDLLSIRRRPGTAKPAWASSG